MSDLQPMTPDMLYEEIERLKELLRIIFMSYQYMGDPWNVEKRIRAALGSQQPAAGAESSGEKKLSRRVEIEIDTGKNTTR